MHPIPTLTRTNIRVAISALLVALIVALLALFLQTGQSANANNDDARLNANSAQSDAVEPQTLVGWFSIHWQDDFASDDSLLPTSMPIYILDVEIVDESPQRFTARLLLDDALELPDGELDLFNQQRVRIEAVAVDPSSADVLGDNTYRALKIEAEPLDGDVGGVSVLNVGGAVTGPQPWVIVRCRFPDLPLPNESGTSPGSAGYFNALINNPNGLNAYFDAVSYGKTNLNGSTVIDQWFDLPQSRADYGLTSNPDRIDVIAAGGDCIDAADAAVDFAPYTGIGIVLNDDECCQGGFRFLSLDGENRIWGVTYMSSDASHLVWAHELGHGFGLPHTAGNGREYNDPWSVMGVSACFTDLDPAIGCIGQHPIAEQKSSILGWLSDDRVLTVPSASNRTVLLERLAQPATVNPQMLRVPIQGSDTRFYTVEARNRIGFDANLPDDAVVIHLVDQEKPPDLQADVVGIPAADSYYFPSDATTWKPGRNFTDAANDIRIQVLTATSSGYVINVQNGSLPLSAVTLASPEVSLSNSVSLFADSRPITASVPITYLWEATDLPPIQLTGGVSSVVDLLWPTSGTKTITVTATNPANQVVSTKNLTVLGADLALSAMTTTQPVQVGDTVTATLAIDNLGPDSATDVALSIKLNNVDAPSVGDSTEIDFSRGTLNNVFYAGAEGGVTLNAAGRAAGQGVYESAILDGGLPQKWRTIEWQPQFPMGVALPNRAQSESGYPTGTVNMAGNVMLLHLDELQLDKTDSATAFANAASPILPGGICNPSTCPGSTADGRFSAAATFSGSQSITVAADPRFNFGVGGFSQELWFYPTTQNSAPQGLLGAGEGGDQYPSLYYEDNGIRFRFGHQGGSAWVQSVESITVDAWNHVAVAFDGTTFTLFINGEEKYRADDWAGNIPRPAVDGLQIGRIGEDFFVGRIDEVALYRRALSAGEVADRYRRGVTQLGFQIRACETATCDSVAYQGRDGTAESYFTAPDNANGNGPLRFLDVATSTRYLQYQARLTTEDPGYSPVLQAVTFAPTYGLPDAGTCRGTADLLCRLEALAAGETTQVRLVFAATKGGTIAPQALVQSATFDPVTENNDGNVEQIIVESPAEPVSNTALRGQSVTFESSIVAGANAIYRWDFGDGSTGIGNPVEHIYAKPGLYTVTVTVTAEGDSTGRTESQEIQILEQIYLPNVFN